MKPLVFSVCLTLLAWNSHARAADGGHINEYELAVPATFAITLSQAKALNQEAAGVGGDSVTLTSSNIVQLFGLPQDARCYWVFDLESKSSLVAGALVIASKESGEIYREFAYGFGITLFDLIEGGEADKASVGVIQQDQGRTSIIVNLAMTWNIGNEIAPVATFGRFSLQIDQSEQGTSVSFCSVSDLAGDGLENNGLMVTKGRLEAKGEVLQVTP